MEKKKDILFIIIFTFFIVLNLIIIFGSRLLPFTDLPNHLAEATIYRYYNDSSNQFSKYFILDNLFAPNRFYLFFFSLKIFPTVEFACKVFYGLYVILLPLSVLLVIKRIDRNKWFSLLSFLFIYNFNVTWGFSNFTIAIPIFLFAIYFMLVATEKKDFKYFSILFAVMVFLIWIHVLVVLFLILLILIYSLLLLKKEKKLALLYLLSILPIILIIMIWWISVKQEQSFSTFDFLYNYFRDSYFDNLLLRLSFIWSDNHQLFSGWTGRIIGSTFSMVFIVPFVYLFIKNYRIYFREIRERNNLLIWSFLFISIFVILFMPEDFPGEWVTLHRFGVFILLGIILFISNRIEVKKYYLYLIIGTLIAHMALWSNYFFEFNTENKYFNEQFLPKAPKEGVLAGMVYDPFFRGKCPYLHFPSYLLIWNKGISITSIVDYRFRVVTRKTKNEELQFYNLFRNYNEFTQEKYSFIKYLLIRFSNSSENIYIKNYRFLRHTGKWYLYQRKE